MSARDYLVAGVLLVSTWSWVTPYPWFVDCVTFGALFCFAMVAEEP